TLLREIERAVMAVWIVSWPTEQDVRRPRTTAAARVGVVAGLAAAPQIVDRAVSCKGELGAVGPDVLQGLVADVSARVLGRGERRTTFDRPVGFEADRVLAGVAAEPVTDAGLTAAP